MKLSMWILADWLKEYRPVNKIKEGRRVLRNVRVLSDNKEMLTSVVYVGRLENFMTRKKDQIFCVHGQDMLILDTDNLDEIFNKVLDAFDYYNEWSDGMKRIVQNGGSLDALLQQAYPAIGSFLTVADPGFMNLAVCGNNEILEDNPDMRSILKNSMMTQETIYALNRDKRIYQKTEETYLFGEEIQGFPTIVRNLFYNNSHIGWLVNRTRSSNPGRSCYDLLDEVGDIVQIWYGENQNAHKLQTMTEMIREMFERDTVTQNDGKNFSLLGWSPKDDKRLVVVRNQNNESVLLQLRHRMELFQQEVIAFQIEDMLVVLLNRKLSEEKGVLQEMSVWMGQTESYALCSQVFSSYEDMLRQYHLCDTLLHAETFIPGKIYPAEQYVMPYALHVLENNLTVDMVASAVKILKTYDEKNKTELSETLFTYIQNNCNYADTARILCIHRNSVIYRIEKAIDLTGADLQDARQRFYIWLSFYLAETM